MAHSKGFLQDPCYPRRAPFGRGPCALDRMLPWLPDPLGLTVPASAIAASAEPLAQASVDALRAP
jgi:hypothetical protein